MAATNPDERQLWWAVIHAPGPNGLRNYRLPKRCRRCGSTGIYAELDAEHGQVSQVCPECGEHQTWKAFAWAERGDKHASR